MYLMPEQTLFTPVAPPGLMAKIIGQIKDNIAAGRLQKGDKLPGERQMAEQLGLSRATVREAVKALESELTSTLDAYREYVNQFTQRVDYLASGISEALKQMPDAVTDSSERFLDQVDRLTDSLDQARQGLDEAAARLYRR